MCIPSNRASEYTRQKVVELKGEIDISTHIVGHVSIPLLITDSTNRQKISIDIEDKQYHQPTGPN